MCPKTGPLITPMRHYKKLQQKSIFWPCFLSNRVFSNSKRFKFSLFELTISKKVAISLKDDTSIPQKIGKQVPQFWRTQCLADWGIPVPSSVWWLFLLPKKRKNRYNVQFYLQKIVKITYFWIVIQNTFGTPMCLILVPFVSRGCGVPPCCQFIDV